MNNLGRATVGRNWRKKLPLLFSSAAVSFLFLSPTRLSLAIAAAIFAVAAVGVCLEDWRAPRVFSRKARLVAAASALLVILAAVAMFYNAWTSADSFLAEGKMRRLLPTPTLAAGVALVCGIGGFYALYVFFCRLWAWVRRMLAPREGSFFSNLRRNWFFLVSAAAFFCLNATLTLRFLLSLLFALVAAAAVAGRVPSIFSAARKHRPALQIVSLLTAAGVCWYAQTSFQTYLRFAPTTRALEARLPVAIDLSVALSLLGAVVGLFFVYVCVQFFWQKLAGFLAGSGAFSDISVAERVLYGVLLAANLALMIVSFAGSHAFYGSNSAYAIDLIYTSDSPSLVSWENCYLSLMHPENDLRQMLFAVFSAPFIGIPYLLGEALGLPMCVRAMLMDAVQVTLLFAANLLLARTLRLSPLKRACFMTLLSFTYMHLLFTLMMEQYIIAYFYLIIAVYQIAERKKLEAPAFWAVSGTLLTGAILLPFASEHSPRKAFAAWFKDMIKQGIAFLAFLLACCRFDVLFDLAITTSGLVRFTGASVTMADKFRQYAGFVHNCLLAPKAGPTASRAGRIAAQLESVIPETSWQLQPIAAVNWVGVAIFLLAVLSVLCNRRKRSTLVAAFWVGYSVAILLLVGWGASENGLILYSLYFGWAFFVLVFQLIETLADRLHAKFLLPVLAAGATALLAWVNLPAIVEMVRFAIATFPA